MIIKDLNFITTSLIPKLRIQKWLDDALADSLVKKKHWCCNFLLQLFHDLSGAATLWSCPHLTHWRCDPVIWSHSCFLQSNTRPERDIRYSYPGRVRNWKIKRQEEGNMLLMSHHLAICVPGDGGVAGGGGGRMYSGRQEFVWAVKCQVIIPWLVCVLCLLNILKPIIDVENPAWPGLILMFSNRLR